MTNMTKEEFVKILEDSGITDLNQLAEKVLEEIEREKKDINKVGMKIDKPPYGVDIVDL